MRTDHRRYEVSLVGTPLRNLEDQELRWNIESKHTGDEFTVKQELAHVTMKHDGEIVVDRDIDPGAVVAQIIIDRAGNLVDVRTDWRPRRRRWGRSGRPRCGRRRRHDRFSCRRP